MNSVEYREPAANELVAEKFRLTRLIGRGGMGSVWEGVHITLGTRVAVKFIDSNYADNPEARQRFDNEARAAAKLNSKYAVKVFDHGVMVDGRPFIVMEFLAGEPLDVRIERLGHLEPIETAQILSQVCRALSRAHGAGIVHRDLKPENVFLVNDEEDHADIAKVVDFGIAKFTDTGLGISSSTRTGSVLGTPFYMSPEQARGLRTVDYRTDLWSLGVIAYRCVVGRLPFESESLGDLLVKICTADLPVPSLAAPWCPPGFDAWFARAMQREPSARFASAQELAEQLMLVCGVGTARQPLPSGHEPYHHVSTPQPTNLASGVASFGGVVEGTTAPRVADTDGAFSQTNLAAGRRKKTLLLSLGGGLVVVGLVTSVAVLVSKRTASDESRSGDLAVASSGVPAAPAATAALGVPDVARSVSPASAVDAPSVVLADPPAGSSSAASAAVPVAPPRAQPPRGGHATAVRPPPARIGAPPAQAPPAPAPRRPSGKGAIDLGY